jgi:hypothetical protein
MGQGSTQTAPGTKAQPQNPWEASRQAYQGQGELLAGASRPGAMAGMYGTYMNPYTSDVIDRTTADMQRQGQMGLRDLGATAHGQGAFGGSRHGIAEGTLMGEVNKNVGDQAARLRESGFNTSMGLAGQDIGNQFAGAGALGNFGNSMMGVGQNLSGQQTQNGQTIGGINDSLIGQAAGMFDRYTGQPLDSTMAILGALSGNPLTSTGTQTQTGAPGTKSKLGGALGLAGRVASAPATGGASMLGGKGG